MKEILIDTVKHITGTNLYVAYVCLAILGIQVVVVAIKIWKASDKIFDIQRK